jgi:tRNA (cytidine/uridine-2'-O-)-methyltransferase
VLTSGLGGTNLWSIRFAPNTWIFLGKESAGLPAALLAAHREKTAHIPMQPNTRGLNLSTSAGIVLYEALRQLSSSL